jgi:predicted nucleic-acid-binding Zn-ribbon protein
MVRMHRTGICPKCGDDRIAGPHRVHAGDYHLKIDLPGFPTATLESFTCANCGYTEFYSDRIGLDNIRSSGRFRVSPQRRAPKTCPVCSTEVRPGTTRCSECGYQLN